MRQLSIIAVAIGLAVPVATGLTVLPAAHGAAGTKPLPNACKSFTTHSIDKLIGAKPTTHPKRQFTISNKGAANESNECKVTDKSTTVYIDLGHYAGGSGGGGVEKTYQRPKLGKYGKIAVGQPPSAFTAATYEQHGVFASDDYPGVALPHRGKAMYRFALAQSHWLKTHA